MARMTKACRERNLTGSMLRKSVARDAAIILSAPAQRNQSHKPTLRLRYCSWSFVCSTATSRGATALICAVMRRAIFHQQTNYLRHNSHQRHTKNRQHTFLRPQRNLAVQFHKQRNTVRQDAVEISKHDER